MGEYISLDKLDAYKLARSLSKTAWEIYQKLEWQERKTVGNQFLESTDSVGANIAEGYGRFHYLDRVRFYYNSRGSLLESRHWLELLKERKLIEKSHGDSYLEIYKKLRMVLNRLINSVLKTKKNITIS